MCQRRTRELWSNTGYYALLTLSAVIDVFTGWGWLGGSVDRKRVISHGFIAICASVAVLEQLVLNKLYEDAI